MRGERCHGWYRSTHFNDAVPLHEKHIKEKESPTIPLNPKLYEFLFESKKNHKLYQIDLNIFLFFLKKASHSAARQLIVGYFPLYIIPSPPRLSLAECCMLGLQDCALRAWTLGCVLLPGRRLFFAPFCQLRYRFTKWQSSQNVGNNNNKNWPPTALQSVGATPLSSWALRTAPMSCHAGRKRGEKK